ncbi:hypothetical protein SEA_EMMA1919_216 [Streptomyces phage Emma1919]|uniref:Uncharacterized protein n=2 Tax=Gilsonvirus gilson TaxID=2846398 RepID=A0A3T0ICU8_9CAUD|nr:hypothetical protein HWB98_gp071 [Streptomyces phage Gilson]QQV92555.1 hypothetical protein SEA_MEGANTHEEKILLA_218 [Streptomyces phage MeganTheeKilla]QZE11320.1 hypothetical protein SEA_FORREST_216 [Streptomyces phage Forrest]QZE11548.1 hypothetical protein SEA_JADA_215 [Streptomyces phage Jada]URQ04797.1 hypothetical protein SEA_EMMA1919_216 [Streptomyces phage Emma1919]AZU97258.1 hypothetical protein SEA_GILSON_213 [Streptomyces phage Gilson]
MDLNFSMNPGLEVWLGILPPQWDEDDFDDWEEEEFKVTQKRRIINIRKSDFRRNF